MNTGKSEKLFKHMILKNKKTHFNVYSLSILNFWSIFVKENANFTSKLLTLTIFTSQKMAADEERKRRLFF